MAEQDASPLVRIDFSDDSGWRALITAASAQSPEGFRAELYPVEDRSFDNADPNQLTAADWADAPVLFVADRTAISSPDHSILCIDLLDEPGRSFRCIPAEIWGVESNLRIANMDFAEFAESVDSDGVFRGFH